MLVSLSVVGAGGIRVSKVSGAQQQYRDKKQQCSYGGGVEVAK